MGTQIHLAAIECFPDLFEEISIPYTLTSYIYFDGKKKLTSRLKKTLKILLNSEHYLLDSGAFTYRVGTKKITVRDMDEYVKRYSEFLQKYKIKYYIEMDVDDMGLNNVERWRNYLETSTGRKCIPVWHKGRGINYWIKMVTNYDYVAIGGLVGSGTKHRTEEDIELLKKLVSIAHKHNCKVHGLGFTSLKNLEYVGFDTVDSTSWLSAAKYGAIQEFKDGKFTSVNLKTNRKTPAIQYFRYGLKLWKKVVNYYDK